MVKNCLSCAWCKDYVSDEKEKKCCTKFDVLIDNELAKQEDGCDDYEEKKHESKKIVCK